MLSMFPGGFMPVAQFKAAILHVWGFSFGNLGNFGLHLDFVSGKQQNII